MTPITRCTCMILMDFNPHPRTKDDCMFKFPMLGASDFNPHPRTKDDCIAYTSWIDNTVFQSTSSHKGWLTHIRAQVLRVKFQSTSSHKGWPQKTSWRIRNWIISIHILAQRMTIIKADKDGNLPISIHILAQRMTGITQKEFCDKIDFNPHPRTKDDWNRASKYAG